MQSRITSLHVSSPSRSHNLPMAIRDSHRRELAADRIPDEIASARNLGVSGVLLDIALFDIPYMHTNWAFAENIADFPFDPVEYVRHDLPQSLIFANHSAINYGEPRTLHQPKSELTHPIVPENPIYTPCGSLVGYSADNSRCNSSGSRPERSSSP